MLSYLAEAIAAGYAYAWERFGIADSTLAAVRQAACAYAAEQRAAASAEVATDSKTPRTVAQPPAGSSETEPASEVCWSTEDQQEGSLLEAAAVVGKNAAPAPDFGSAPAVLQPLGCPCAAQQPCLLDPVVLNSVMDRSAPPGTAFSRSVASAADVLPSANAAACIADLVSQRESLRPLKEHLLVELSFGVLRLALAHLLRLSAGHTA